MTGGKSRTKIRVRYAETDQMGVAYYANYLVWMEVARVAYCRHAGVRVPRHGAEGRRVSIGDRGALPVPRPPLGSTTKSTWSAG